MTRHEIIERLGIGIERERINLGYSQTEMAKKLDISLSSYKRILAGETSKIDFYIIHQMYRLTQKTGCELSGTADRYLDATQKLRQLSPPQLRFALTIIDVELKFKKELDADHTAEDYITVMILTGSMQDGMVYDSFSTEQINIAPYRRRYGDAIDCGLKVTSIYLTPVYHLDDILLISRQPVRDGDTGIFIDNSNGLLYIRTFKQGSPCRLEPINCFGVTFYLDSTSEADSRRWTIVGRVVTKMRT